LRIIEEEDSLDNHWFRDRSSPIEFKMVSVGTIAFDRLVTDHREKPRTGVFFLKILVLIYAIVK